MGKQLCRTDECNGGIKKRNRKIDKQIISIFVNSNNH